MMSEPLTYASIFAVLCTAIGGLWKVLHSQTVSIEKRLSTKLDECETKHEKVNATIIQMSKDLGELQGKHEVINQVMELLSETLSTTKTTTTRRTTRKTDSDE